MIRRYTREDMGLLWGDRTRYETWLEVELAVCRAMEGDGVVPEGTADRIRLKVSLDPAQIEEIETRVRHDVIAFLTHVEQQAGEPARWLHLGMTSSDVLDTAFALQLKQAGLMIVRRIDDLLVVLERRARETKHLTMVGRTHGIHAEPTCVGLVFAGYYAEMTRHRARVVQAVKSVGTGKISGAVGTYANLPPAIEAKALESLGLQVEPCATQVVPRDRHAEFFAALAVMAATMEKMGVQVRHWQRTEVGEARESFGRGQKGSSAMPHKRNPILSENLCGLARLVRGYATMALENVPLWHERDISHSSVERVIAPDATIVIDFMLHRVLSLMDGLVIDEQRLRQNLQLTGGLIYSEAVMLAMVRKGTARQKAYELVQRVAMAAQERGAVFCDLLLSDAEVARYLSAAEINECFDEKHHLRHVEVIFDRVFSAAAG